MRIKKLELIGFKSFKDRTVIEFHSGITGVVGPNGCGKSNIVDALVWVMGEQSAKHLRGSSMEDVIFAGSEGYAPTGLAEVSLVLENDGGPFPAKYARHTEIMVTRRLHRSGESEYLINKEQSRLRDIQEIFMDTGIGSKGFSIIEQGAIGKIITAKPEERRVLIEEAAGITKFKVRKRESEKKLASTDQNLIRLADIIGEIKRQLDSLQRQAKKAEKYRELKNSARDLDLWLSCVRLKEMQAELVSVQTALEEYKNTEIESQAQVSALDTSVQELRLRLVEIEKNLHEKQSEKYELQSVVQKKEGEVQRIQFEIEQAKRSEEMAGNLLQDLDIRKNSITKELDQVRSKFDGVQFESTRANNLFQQHQGLLQDLRKNLVESDDLLIEKRRELVAIHQAQSHLSAQAAGTESRVSELSERDARSESVWNELESKKTEYQQIRTKHFNELEKERQLQLSIMAFVDSYLQNKNQIEENIEKKRIEVENKKDELNKIESRLYGLQNLDANFEGFQEGVKNIMGWQKDNGNQNEFSLVADLINVPVRFEVAMESALGHRLQLILSQSLDGPSRAIDLLKANKWGRSSFLSLALDQENSSPRPPDSSVIEACLKDVVQIFGEEQRKALLPLFEKVAVVSTLDKGLALRSEFRDWTFVTLDGDMISHDGIVTGGTIESADSGVLRRRREMKELQIEKDKVQAQLSIAQIELKKLTEKFEGVESDLENAQKQRVEKEILIAEKKKDLERSENELQNLIQALTRQKTELDEVRGQLQTQNEKLATCKTELNLLLQKQSDSEKEVERLTASLVTIRSQVEVQQNETTELQVKAASSNQEAEGLRRQIEMYSQSLADIEEQIGRMSQESSKSNESMSQGQILLTESRIQLEKLVEEVKILELGLAGIKDGYETQTADLRKIEAKLSEHQKKFQDAQSSAGELRLKFEQLSLRESNLQSQVFEKYSLNISEVYPQYENRAMDTKAVETELADLRDKLSKMGEVSLAAIEEYDELAKRHDFLTKQQSDLLESQVQLRKVIDRIDKICSKQFKDTFDAVNERFQKVFPVLFGGGEAHLLMVEEEGESDPGIDIVVHPPGKKSQSITLLSGGEKALTSVALIFSIFLVKPSPFCLLDEVDAPLDDANVFRFNELVKEMAKRSQIIVVTHNKYTMEVNNILYGVTMEERGVSKMVSVDLKDIPSSRNVDRPAEVTA